jgi:hypothetical protein
MEGQVGLKEGLHVKDGRVYVLKLWLRLFPGDMHADLQKLSNACFSKRVDFGQVNPQEYVTFWGLMVAKTVDRKRDGDLWENSNILDGIRDQPQFQKYMEFRTVTLFVLLSCIVRSRYTQLV